MEFIKVGKNYMIKNSNGRIVSEKEKLELENKEIMISPVDCACPDKIKKISKNKKKIKEIEKENVKINVDLKPIDSKRVVKYIKEQTALQDKENADETIKETDTTI